MSQHQKFVCRCKVCIYENIMHSYLIAWRQKHLKILDPNSSGCHRLSYVDNCVTQFSQYIDEVMPYIKNLQNRSRHAAYATMCPFYTHDLDIPYLKWDILFFSFFLPVKIPYKDTQYNIYMSNILVHIYNEFFHWTLQGKIPIGATYRCYLCHTM